MLIIGINIFSIILFLIGLLFLIIGNMLIRSIFGILRERYILKGGRVVDGKEVVTYIRASGVLGPLETFAYAFAYCLGHSEFIGVWLGIKAIGRWSSNGPKSTVEFIEGLKKKPAEQRERMNAEINVYLIGNLLSVILGVLVGLIWKHIN